jgi:hypothetical protein
MMAPPPRKNRTWKGPRVRPATLPDAACYVLWRYGSKPNGKGKYPKLPFNPHKQYTDRKPKGTYTGAKTDDSATWGTWDECMAAADDWPGWFDGIGKVLMPGEIGIDLDDGIDPVHAEMLHKDARGRAYRETSVSRGGSHIIILGTIAGAIKTDTIEIYPGGSDTGRYFALGDELEGSAAPAAAQDVVDQAVTLSGAQPRSSAPRASLRMVETVALTAELAGAIRDAESRKADLLLELRSNMTVQLADLLCHGIFPPAMKDTSASGARAVVVAQLHRAPKRRYSDAEIYVLARELWHRKQWEGAMSGHEKSLSGDCWRLIASYRPGAPPKKTTRPYQEAPAPLVYLARLADEANGNVVLLSRDERAALVGCTRATAQRVEEQLVTQKLIELHTYALTGEGCKGRRGMIRITSRGQRALNESVISTTPQPDEQVTASAPARHKPPISPAKNTSLLFVLARRPHHHKQTRVLSGAGPQTGEADARPVERDQGDCPVQPRAERQQPGMDAGRRSDRAARDRQRLLADQSGQQLLRLPDRDDGSVQGRPENESAAWAAADAWLETPEGQRLAAKAQRASVSREVYARIDPIASGRDLPAPPRAECGYTAAECDRWLAAHATGAQPFGAPIAAPEVAPAPEVHDPPGLIARLRARQAGGGPCRTS